MNLWIKYKTVNSELIKFYGISLVIVFISIVLCYIPFERAISDIITPKIQQKYSIKYELFETTADGSSVSVPVTTIHPNNNISTFSKAIKYVIVSSIIMILSCILFNYGCRKDKYIIDARRIISIITVLTVLLGIFVFFTHTERQPEYVLDKEKFKSSEKYVEIDNKPVLAGYLTTKEDSIFLENTTRNIEKINHFANMTTLMLGTWLIPLNYYQNKHENSCQ